MIHIIRSAQATWRVLVVSLIATATMQIVMGQQAPSPPLGLPATVTAGGSQPLRAAHVPGLILGQPGRALAADLPHSRVGSSAQQFAVHGEPLLMFGSELRISSSGGNAVIGYPLRRRLSRLLFRGYDVLKPSGRDDAQF